MVLEDHPLTIESTYPLAEKLSDIGRKEEADPEGVKFRNSFWSWRYKSAIVVWEENGRILHGTAGSQNQIGILLGTLGASDAWGIEQEGNAVQLLGKHLRHRQFKQYLLTGMFLERSPRSGVHYLFRRLRPTVAMSEKSGSMKFLAALCMHPIGYYHGSWAGAMTPTDDVIAHLMLMRGDEHMFWRRCEQHPPYKKEAGL